MRRKSECEIQALIWSLSLHSVDWLKLKRWVTGHILTHSHLNCVPTAGSKMLQHTEHTWHAHTAAVDAQQIVRHSLNRTWIEWEKLDMETDLFWPAPSEDLNCHEFKVRQPVQATQEFVDFPLKPPHIVVCFFQKFDNHSHSVSDRWWPKQMPCFPLSIISLFPWSCVSSWTCFSLPILNTLSPLLWEKWDQFSLFFLKTYRVPSTSSHRVCSRHHSKVCAV